MVNVGKGMCQYITRGGGVYTHEKFFGVPHNYRERLVFDSRGTIMIDGAVQAVACEWKLSPVQIPQIPHAE